MSDEFIKVATREIKDELSGITTILGSCSNDDDISKNSDKIEQHMHKIKGLAPMMGKENVGRLAKSLDFILKKIVSGKKIDGFYEPLCVSIEQMSMAMERFHDLNEIQNNISNITSKIVD
jgi:chemotaxis protein histidine kinase CheA